MSSFSRTEGVSREEEAVTLANGQAWTGTVNVREWTR